MDTFVTSFTVTDGALVAGPMPTESPYIGSGFPRHLALFVVRGRTRTRVRQLESLAGHVKLSSPQEALDFVRLPTSPRTYEMFDSNVGHDILDRSQITIGTVYGDTEWLNRLMTDSDGLEGVVDHSRYRDLGLPPVRVETSLRGYWIRRPVFRLYDNPGQKVTIMYVQQLVSAKGEIAATRLERLPPSIAKALNWDTWHEY